MTPPPLTSCSYLPANAVDIDRNANAITTAKPEPRDRHA